MKFPLAAATVGPKGVGTRCEQAELSLVVMKWSVAPESAMAEVDLGKGGGITALEDTTFA